MTNKLSDVLPPKEELYPGVERVKAETLLGKTFIIKDAQEREGEDGKYFVCLLELGKKEYSTAFGSKVVTGKIGNIPEDKFPVEVTMVEVKSKSSGRMYHDLQ